ncbi:GNAT family N-acetyltransferase [Halorarum halophilum]|uniref:GNAT family N-acetyltransferase n=1 Tax=Halorarum halophilum TaxID=2743090 RepID=A0A7D5KEV1_9EURY|nr:GNAT family N-acetyltransferase [Halobaculum halophilum]QLG28537.1 GNAT family N-acetyltransferase [Halobaculum halophilum]
MVTTEDGRSEYAVRQYEPSDREEVLSLYGTVFGRDDESWFDWRYVDNPYLSEVPICVADRDGEVVGARPSLPFPLRVGGERVLAIAQVDPMVAPEHRRRGLFSRMVTHVYGYYADREPSVSIGFPNEAVMGALSNLDEELSLHRGVTREFPVHYRLQDPGALLSSKVDDGALGRLVGGLAGAAGRGVLSVRTGSPGGSATVTVTPYDGVPAAELANLAERSVTPRAHAYRDETFYRWRYANPRFDYVTYVADVDGRREAALMVGRKRAGDVDVVHVSDVAPLGGREPWRTALDHLFSRVVADFDDADLLAVAGEVVPAGILDRYRFRPATAFPLSRLTATTYLVARPLTNRDVDEWRVGGQVLSEDDRWRFTFCEREIG